MDRDQRNQHIEQYAAGASMLIAAWDEAPEEMRAWRPSAGAWSAHEIVVHCADSETYAATRIRLLTAEPSPMIAGYDQERWAITFDYHSLPSESALTLVQAVRAHTTSVIRSLTDEQWTAIGMHSEMGTYSAIDWLRIYAVHLHDHANQIRANIAAWRSCAS